MAQQGQASSMLLSNLKRVRFFSWYGTLIQDQMFLELLRDEDITQNVFHATPTAPSTIIGTAGK